MEITVTELKVKCLAVLSQLQASGERIVVTKRGKAIAEIKPLSASSSLDRNDELLGSVTINADLLEPVLPAKDWEAEEPTSWRRRTTRKSGSAPAASPTSTRAPRDR